MRINPERIKIFRTQHRARGGKGEVTLASLVPRPTNGSQSEGRVAVKKLYFTGDSNLRQFYNAFAHEARLLHSLFHPNIVRLLGFVEDRAKKIAWLIFPWEPNGNLREFLGSGRWEIPERISLIRDAISGIEYLHTQQPPICHGDLKSLNILVNCDHHAVITDFGSARVVGNATDDEASGSGTTKESSLLMPIKGAAHSFHVDFSAESGTLTLTGPHGTLRWEAPEVMLEEIFDLPGDIWAFGWICWEGSPA